MLRYSFFIAILVLGNFARPATAQDVCQIDQSVAYAPRANCLFPACPLGAACPAPELQLDRQSSSVDLSDPLLSWNAQCPDTTLTGGCWQATFEAALHLGATGQADSLSIKLVTDDGQQASNKEYTVKPDRVNDSRLQGKIAIVYYVPAGQNFSLRVDSLCAKTKAGRQLCVRPIANSVLNWRAARIANPTSR